MTDDIDRIARGLSEDEIEECGWVAWFACVELAQVQHRTKRLYLPRAPYPSEYARAARDAVRAHLKGPSHE